MPFSLGLITVTSGQTFKDNIGNGPSVANVVLYNESNFALQVALGSNAQPLWLPAWTGDKFSVNGRGSFDGNLVISNQMISSSANPPSSAVLGNVYAVGEDVPGTYPIALARQTNIGNQVATTSSNSVINDGNAAPTQVVEGTPLGAGSSQLKLNNDGSAILGGGLVTLSSAGIFTALPANSVPAAAINGSVANATNATNATTASALAGAINTYANGAFHIDGIATETPASNGRSILFQSWDGSAQHNAFSVGSPFTANCAVLDNGGLWLHGGSNTFGGTGSGTYSHSLGQVPVWCGITDNTASSTVTVGAASYGSSTVVVTLGAAHTVKCIVL